ncbi:anti-sigma factor [Blastococcus sp. VKM Ac-2987]|uniref:anti-sigma factor n=1 Tax=Blastococcus sp. VKM Ac-2987 TaxID=3004141 RepID=UPI0022AB5D53|nr:anti-sigma factor [Blastococcus sp. VKM Ac-2987]MCZ2858645.1 anti-sigma factor [Blastococcus sp. VKM Ac-2987]
MPHCQPEQLALAALGEPLPADAAAHLVSCGDCRSEVRSLQRAVDAVDVPEFAASVAPVAPPASVWAGIAAATGVSPAPRSEASVVTAPPPPVAVAPAAPVPDDPPQDPPAGGQVLPFRSRRPRVLMTAAAALVGAVVGAGAVAVLNGSDDAQPLTSVALDQLAEAPASGRAEVVVRGDGSRALEVELDAPALDGEYYEIWLIEPNVVEMVPLGVVRPGAQSFELPTGLDLGQYPIVDVSVEPLDGDPTHSGVSVARGVLES